MSHLSAEEIWTRKRGMILKNKTAVFFCTAMLFAAAPVFADGFGSHSSNSEKGFALKAEVGKGLGQEFSFSGTESLASQKNLGLGALMNAGPHAEQGPAKKIDVDIYSHASHENKKGKIHDGDGDNTAAVRVVPVGEPGTQIMLFFGLAAIGMLACLRNTLRIAI